MRPGADVAFLRNPLWVLALTLTLGLAAVPAAAQDLEVRRWSHLPVGVNTLAVGYAGQDTRIYFNPIVGITDGTADLNAWVARYSHTFDWSGKTARIDVMLPYVSGTWQGLVDGVPGQRTIRDRGDPWIRLGLNFYGAPANSGNAYRNYIAEHPIRTTIGASLAVSPPLGDYDPTELINVGTNRYAVRPQLGMLHVRRAWSFELTGSVFIFQDNTDFVDAITLSQKPVWALQGHVTRNFNDNVWLGVGLAYAIGGKVRLDEIQTRYKVDNLLWNAVGSFRVTENQSLALAWQQGRTQVNVGTDSDSWLVSWIFAW